jgi:hypothetical protein
MMKFPYVRHCTLSEARDYWRNKVDGDAQWVTKWRGAGVALCSHPTHTDTKPSHSLRTNVPQWHLCMFCVSLFYPPPTPRFTSIQASEHVTDAHFGRQFC